MRNAIFAAAGIAALVFAPASADDGLSREQQRTVDKIIERALKDDTAFEIVESLTTEVGPRLAGTQSEARAREWAVAKLKSLGFKNVRIETFEMPAWTRTHEHAAIVSPFPQSLTITALGNSVATPEKGIEAAVVRFRTFDELKSAPMTGLEGKIVFVDEKMARTQDGSSYGVAVRKRSGAAVEAGKRGAAAALIRSVGTDLDRRDPHTGVMNYGDGARIPTAALSNTDSDQLARAIRYSKRPVVLRLEIGVHVDPKATSGNVIGEIPGSTDELIVVGGHLDSWDLGTGAIDDGAGVAITAAAAKVVRDVAGKPRRTLRVVLWGAEEVGLLGALAYAKAHQNELSRHVLASESDFGADVIWQFQSGFGASALPKAKTIAAALQPLGIGPGDNSAGGGPDVGPLRAAGVPVFTLRQSGWDYFDLHHTAEDTLDKIDPTALKQNVAAWAVTLYLASELPGDFREAAPVAAP